MTPLRTQLMQVDAQLSHLDGAFKEELSAKIGSVAIPLVQLMADSRYYRGSSMVQQAGALLRD